MVGVEEYVKRLKALRLESESKYLDTLKYYETNYPQFYAQLKTALETTSKPATTGRLMSFVKQYKYYLAAIITGCAVIIYLLVLLITP